MKASQLIKMIIKNNQMIKETEKVLEELKETNEQLRAELDNVRTKEFNREAE